MENDLTTNTYKPVIGSWYWHITGLNCGLNDSVVNTIFEDWGWHRRRVRNGNCFRTKREAMEKLRQIKIILREK